MNPAGSSRNTPQPKSTNKPENDTTINPPGEAFPGFLIIFGNSTYLGPKAIIGSGSLLLQWLHWWKNNYTVAHRFVRLDCDIRERQGSRRRKACITKRKTTHTPTRKCPLKIDEANNELRKLGLGPFCSSTNWSHPVEKHAQQEMSLHSRTQFFSALTWDNALYTIICHRK